MIARESMRGSGNAGGPVVVPWLSSRWCQRCVSGSFRLLAWLAFVVPLATGLSAQDRDAARRSYEVGREASRAGRTDEAIEAFRLAVAADPTEWRYSYALGEVLQDRAQRWPEAVAALEDAWDKGYREGITRYRIAQCLYQMQDEDGALAGFEQALAMHEAVRDTLRRPPSSWLRTQLAVTQLWIARIRADRRDFESAYRSALAALQLDAQKDHRGRVLSLGHVAFGWAAYDDAIRLYELSLRDFETGRPLTGLGWNDYPDWRLPTGVMLEVARNRARLGTIQPAYTHAVLALVIRDQDVEIEQDGSKLRVHKVIDDRQVREAEARLRWLKQVVESMSDGQLSVSFMVREDTTHYRYEAPTRPAWIGDRSVIGPLVDDYDTLIRLWPYSEGYGTGGAGRFDLAPFAQTTARRGGVSIHPEHSYGMWVHEFFHVVEAMTGITPTHGYYDEQRGRFPGWTGPKNAQLDYFRWHFRTTLPRVGWANLNFRVKYPVGLPQTGATASSARAVSATSVGGSAAPGGGTASTLLEPVRISVLPVFFVPRGERVPTADEKALLAAHLDMSRRRYIELLAGRDSFLVEREAFVHLSDRSMAYFRQAYDQGASELVAELLRARGVGRYDAPNVYVVVTMNDREDFPPGAGRPINGGLGTGAGLVMVSSTGLTKSRNFQSTLEHELGHAFGLVHADAYGESMETSRSLMSYNVAHHTDGLRPSATPGELIPVELLSLALNRRVFPALTRGEAVAVPPSTRPGIPDLWWLPPMAVEGYPAAAPTVTTPSGEAYETKVSRIVVGRVRPDAGPGVTFDAGNMWHPSTSQDGWVELDIAFPEEVTLTGLGLHTGHSGLYHHAVEVRVEVENEGARHLVAQSPVRPADCLVEIPASSGRGWRVRLKGGESGLVTLRGLEFRGASGEDIYPPLVREAPPARESCRDR